MSSKSASHEYRRDIDGLRAIAILPVLFYHSGIPLFSGGFVGVDVFFVISGYLIAGIIAREVDEKRFSIINFYERRARRIMPALMVMILAVLIAASILYLPSDFEKVPRSALLAILFVSNVGFFAETGYFAGGAETMPLLHTWSLAVEEQFYLGFPILLILISRSIPRYRTLVIAGITLFSFAIAVATQASGSGFAFYLLPPRAWELFVGALLATATLPPLKSIPLREGLAFSGLAMIAYSAFFFTGKTVFPGVNAAFPVLGSAALIYCAQGTLVGRVLQTRPFVGVGLISYSLYLWHWPLIVFAEYHADQKLAGWVSVFVIAGAVALAILSWRYVERPFRQAANFDRRVVFRWTFVTMTAGSIASVALMVSGGWPSRFSAEVLRMQNASADISPARGACISDAITGDRAECTLGAKVAPTALLWGDSHGVEMAWALSEKMSKRGASIMQRTRGSCPPIIGYGIATDPNCSAFNRDVISTIEANPNLKTVILSGFWAGGAYTGIRNERALDETINRLLALGRRVIVIGPVPPQATNVPRRLAHLARRGEADAAVGVSRGQFEQSSAWFKDHYGRWRVAGVQVVEPGAILCDAVHCALIMRGIPLYFDSHHLSLSAARVIVASHPEL